MKKNIILQDSDYNLIVLDMNGKETLRKKLNSKIISDIFQVDLYKNNRLQYSFLTEEEFLILDIKGNLVKKISHKKTSYEKIISVFDYFSFVFRLYGSLSFYRTFRYAFLLLQTGFLHRTASRRASLQFS